MREPEEEEEEEDGKSGTERLVLEVCGRLYRFITVNLLRLER
jgi:hypothetical protein